ncbi:hypothetical protein DVS28_a1109 [Euzebya pacifica]|uniref:Uncharacterized protein n=1 Tax=Euzebya pacifica TaxID=1608957 RepID=A0A346XUB2_9ACTN|nr:hypothetical protein DVS28_a1109 [Euzebya pacifica]
MHRTNGTAPPPNGPRQRRRRPPSATHTTFPVGPGWVRTGLISPEWW